MHAGAKFAIGAALIVGAVGYLMASGVKQTGQFFLTPSELSQRVAADPSFYNLGMKVGARVVPGTVARDPAAQTLRFQTTDRSARRLQRDGVIYATDVLAKCGSRYEAVPKAG